MVKLIVLLLQRLQLRLQRYQFLLYLWERALSESPYGCYFGLVCKKRVLRPCKCGTAGTHHVECHEKAVLAYKGGVWV